MDYTRVNVHDSSQDQRILETTAARDTTATTVNTVIDGAIIIPRGIEMQAGEAVAIWGGETDLKGVVI